MSFSSEEERMSEKPLAVVTGANSGVGYETTRVLAREGWEVVMVCRSQERGAKARGLVLQETPTAELRLEVCDLEDFDQVREFASAFKASLTEEGRQPTALVNNAGLYRAGREITGDGFERTMAVNHLGHFLLTLLLEEALRRPGVRIVNVSSQGHTMGKLSGENIQQVFRGENAYNGWQAYGDSKLANVLFAKEIQRRWGGDGVLAFSMHPGVLSTEIWDRNRTFGMVIAKLMKPFMSSPEVGGEAVSRLVTDPDIADRGGRYFKKLREIDPAPLANDVELAAALWEESAKAVGLV